MARINEATLSELTDRLGVARHRIAYAMLAGGIHPVRRVGRTRVYDAAAVRRIERVLGRSTQHNQSQPLQ